MKIGLRDWLKKRERTYTEWKVSWQWMVPNNDMYFRFSSTTLSFFHSIACLQFQTFWIWLCLLYYPISVLLLSGGAFHVGWQPRKNMATQWKEDKQACVHWKEFGWNCPQKRLQRLFSLIFKMWGVSFPTPQSPLKYTSEENRFFALWTILPDTCVFRKHEGKKLPKMCILKFSGKHTVAQSGNVVVTRLNWTWRTHLLCSINIIITCLGRA